MVTPLTGSEAAESRGQWRDARIPPTGVIKQCKVDTAWVWDSKRKACIDAMCMHSATAVVKKHHICSLREENGCVHSHTLSLLSESGAWRIWLFRAEQIRLGRMMDIPAVEGSCYQRPWTGQWWPIQTKQTSPSYTTKLSGLFPHTYLHGSLLSQLCLLLKPRQGHRLT